MLKRYSTLILRIGLAFVLYWFAINQIMNPQQWTRLVPEALSFVDPVTIIYANLIFELILAACLIIFGIYVGISENITIPGRVSMNTYYIEPHGTFFIAGAIFFFAGTLILMILDKVKYKRISMGLMACCFALFTIGIISGLN